MEDGVMEFMNAIKRASNLFDAQLCFVSSMDKRFNQDIRKEFEDLMWMHLFCWAGYEE